MGDEYVSDTSCIMCSPIDNAAVIELVDESERQRKTLHDKALSRGIRTIDHNEIGWFSEFPWFGLGAFVARRLVSHVD